MATWTTIPDSSLEPGKPIRSIDALALRDNPVAIAEHDIGAPYLVNNWYPYDRETNGDGIIYDSAVDGAVASITSPDFEVGYDYLFLASNISDSTLSATTIYFEPYTSPLNAFQLVNWLPIGNTSDTDRAWGSVMASIPRLSSQMKSFVITAAQKASTTTITTSAVNATRVYASAAQTVLRARIRSSGGGTINGGVITMLKRKTNYQDII